MKIISIKDNDRYLDEYVRLCHIEWGNSKVNNVIVSDRVKKIKNGDKVIEVLALIDREVMIGFISLFLYDGDERRDLSPWYATMYVKSEYRGHGYSKLLHEALIKYARDTLYKKIYLKSDLVHYYEKFGAIYMDTLSNGENLFYINIY